MRFCVLHSGSKGNCAALELPDGDIWLIDCGYNQKQIKGRMVDVGLNFEAIRGVFFTHEHKDHIAALEVMLRKRAPEKEPLLLISREATLNKILGITGIAELKYNFTTRVLEDTIGKDLVVTSVPVPHDAADPTGFIFDYEGHRLGFFSDLGCVPPSVIKAASTCTTVYLESNYDKSMIHISEQTRGPAATNRVTSETGHLSNAQAASALKKIAEAGTLKSVVLGHISGQCNTADLAEEAAREVLPNNIKIEVSSQISPTTIHQIDMTQTPQHMEGTLSECKADAQGYRWGELALPDGSIVQFCTNTDFVHGFYRIHEVTQCEGYIYSGRLERMAEPVATAPASEPEADPKALENIKLQNRVEALEARFEAMAKAHHELQSVMIDKFEAMEASIQKMIEENGVDKPEEKVKEKVGSLEEKPEEKKGVEPPAEEDPMEVVVNDIVLPASKKEENPGAFQDSDPDLIAAFSEDYGVTKVEAFNAMREMFKDEGLSFPKLNQGYTHILSNEELKAKLLKKLGHESE